MQQVEPRSPTACSPSPLFRMGKDSRGNWVVQDQRGLCGGLFVGRAEALRYALFENGNQPRAVIMVPETMELDMSGKGAARQDTAKNSLRQRAA